MKPFPPPPHLREPITPPTPTVGHVTHIPPIPDTSTKVPSTPATPFDKPQDEYDPKLNDEETMFILKQYLLPKQFSDPMTIRFILHYITHRSSPDAAEAAGWDRNRGSRVRSNPEIHAAIEALTAKAVMKYGYDANEIIERVKEITNVDPIEFQNPDGSYKTHMSEIRPEARRTIKEFTARNMYGEDANGMRVVIGQLINVKLHDKLKGAELLGSEKNVMKKTTVVQHDVTSNMQSLLLESGRRADERKQLVSREVGNEGVKAGSGGVDRRDGERILLTERGGQGDRDVSDSDIPAVFRQARGTDEGDS